MQSLSTLHFTALCCDRRFSFSIIIFLLLFEPVHQLHHFAFSSPKYKPHNSIHTPTMGSGHGTGVFLTAIAIALGVISTVTHHWLDMNGTYNAGASYNTMDVGLFETCSSQSLSGSSGCSRNTENGHASDTICGDHTVGHMWQYFRAMQAFTIAAVGCAIIAFIFGFARGCAIFFFKLQHYGRGPLRDVKNGHASDTICGDHTVGQMWQYFRVMQAFTIAAVGCAIIAFIFGFARGCATRRFTTPSVFEGTFTMLGCIFSIITWALFLHFTLEWYGCGQSFCDVQAQGSNSFACGYNYSFALSVASSGFLLMASAVFFATGEEYYEDKPAVIVVVAD
ncbi:membrane-associated protein, putative [Bodo saltans]|uniref:Membrane-associated protein, putative n=1 Tax=Bodo saltans TaxID=75058 RepID=A0A0S4IQZ0_BODSA|nr:membrane-associated protein, putative [Bodo saltans]|eukprot:CUF99365.1 membrane-associated protein, putative [Bodo saltans]